MKRRGLGVKGAAVLALMAAVVAGCGVAGRGGALSDPVADPVPDRVVTRLPRVQVEQVVGVEEAEDEGGERDVVEADGLLGVPVAEEIKAEPVRGPAGERVTLTAVGTDLRSLLVALAEAAGVNLVVGPAVEGRVTARFQDVPAAEALEQVVVQTGYMIVRPLTMPWPPTVFHVVPVNVEDADVATIRARFDVSEELARFLIRSRIPPS